MDFSNLTQMIRQELAITYATQPHIPLTDIAALLGYSELSAFSRAFKRWTGMAPAGSAKTFPDQATTSRRYKCQVA